MQYGGRLSWQQWFLGVVGVAAAYLIFYKVNDWVFNQVKVSDFVSWVFLPAAIRMLSVLLFGWAGVLGLFLGSLGAIAHLIAEDPARAITLASLSSVPSLLAARLVQKTAGIPVDLAGLQARHLLLFGLMGGLANSATHTLYFTLHEQSLVPLENFVPMLIGDTVGTLIILYAGALVLRRIAPPSL